MSPARHRAPDPSPLFAALGDPTRLALLRRLSTDGFLSLTDLTEGTRMSRQAVTKHLRILAEAGIVRNVRVGRENLFALEPRPLAELRDFLDRIAKEWDGALARLKAHVEG